MYVEGPYGKPSIPQFKYPSLILMSGGIGITPMASTLSDLVNDIKRGKNNIIKRIHFVWSVKVAEEIKEFDDRHWNVIKKYTDYDSSSNENIKFGEVIKLNDVEIKTIY
eukprot:411386_1